MTTPQALLLWGLIGLLLGAVGSPKFIAQRITCEILGAIRIGAALALLGYTVTR